MQRNTLPTMESTPPSSNKIFNFFSRLRSSNHSLKRAKSTTKLDSRKRSLIDLSYHQRLPALKRSLSLSGIKKKWTRDQVRSGRSVPRVPSPDLNASFNVETLDFSQSESIEIRSLPNGITGCKSQHCFQILAAGRPPMLYSCTSAEDRQNWIENIRYSIEASQEKSVRMDNTISIQISEAKNLPSKKCLYHNQICIDGAIYGETTKISSSAMLFWGEEFKYNNLPEISSLNINLYRESLATKRRHSKKDSVKQLYGVVDIPISPSSQPVERWYPIGSPNDSSGEGQLRVKVRYQTTRILAMHRYSEFIEYLRRDFSSLVTSIEPLVSVKVKEELAVCLVRVAQKLGFPADYLAAIVISEIEKIGSDHENTAFRGNSIATKSMESYMKLVSNSYLKNTLADFVRYMYSTSAQDCEVDDTKLAAGQDLQTQQHNLVYCCTMVWRNIINSHSYFPIELSRVFSRIKLHFTSNDLSYHLLSACVFLRLLCPAILAPNLFELAKCLPLGKSARNLTLVTKTIQTLANFTKFGSKESYMTFMNTFLDKEQRNMQEFIENISYCDTDFRSEYDGYIDLGRELSVLSSILRDTLQQHPDVKMDKLRSIICKLDTPEDPHPPVSPHHGSYQHLPNLRKHHKKHYTGTVPVTRRVIAPTSDNESFTSSLAFTSEINLSHAYDRHSQFYEEPPLKDLVTFIEDPMSRSESTADMVNGGDTVEEVQYIDQIDHHPAHHHPQTNNVVTSAPPAPLSSSSSTTTSSSSAAHASGHRSSPRHIPYNPTNTSAASTTATNNHMAANTSLPLISRSASHVLTSGSPASASAVSSDPHTAARGHQRQRGHSVTLAPPLSSLTSSKQQFAQQLTTHLADVCKVPPQPQYASGSLSTSSRNSSTQVLSTSSSQNVCTSSYPTLNAPKMGVSSIHQKSNSELNHEISKLQRNLWDTQQAYEVERSKSQKLRQELKSIEQVKKALQISEQKCKDQSQQILLLQSANQRLIANIKLNKRNSIIQQSQEDMHLLKSSSC